MVGHVTPEAAVGGAIALIEDGDRIVIDAETKRVDLVISAESLDERRANWTRPPSGVTSGALAKYRATVRSASEGAVTVAPDWE